MSVKYIRQSTKKMLQTWWIPEVELIKEGNINVLITLPVRGEIFYSQCCIKPRVILNSEVRRAVTSGSVLIMQLLV